MEIHALKERGWKISAIARHVGRDRRTVRSYLAGQRVPGRRTSTASDPLAAYETYIRARFTDDHTIWASALFDEVVALGYERSYVTFARQIRLRHLRPHCEACSGVRGRETIEIDHPPGEEIQWDWFERRRSPWGGAAYVLLGTFPHSGRVRGVIAPAMDQAHLIEAMDAVMRRLGGTARVWRVDRLATVIIPGTRDVQPSFAPMAKHYGCVVEPCPPRRGNRKGSVESSVRYVTGRWWKTMTATTIEEAQRSLDRFCSTTAEARVRPVPASALRAVREAMARGEISRPLGAGVTAEGRLWRPTVRQLADAEPLLALPVPFPAVVEVTAPVRDNATVAFRGNCYSTPPGLGGVQLTLRHRLGSGTLEVHSPAGALLVAHRLAPAGAGAIVRTTEHRAALERAVLSAFSMARPCDRKGNSPPGPLALAAAAKLLGPEGKDVVVDLATYQAIAEGGVR